VKGERYKPTEWSPQDELEIALEAKKVAAGYCPKHGTQKCPCVMLDKRWVRRKGGGRT